MKRLRFFIILVLLAASQLQAATWYVKTTGSDSNTGLSWAQAFRNLQTAIDAAQTGDQIWVATGTYSPTTTLGSNLSAYWRTFKIQKDVKIYGGFNGTETALAQRNWTLNETILSGAQDEVLHVVYTNGVSQECAIDGFTITGGNADLGGGTTTSLNSAGGGWYNDAYETTSSPRIANCKFINNNAEYSGGAFLNNSVGGNANLVFTDCRFEGNTAGLFGGAFHSEGNLTAAFTNCVFDQNGGQCEGGAVSHNLTASTSSLTFTHCDFLSQQTTDDGGAVNFSGVEGTRTAVFSDCTFKGNVGKIGAAIHMSENFGNTQLQMINCLLSGNGSRQSPVTYQYLIFIQQSNGSATLNMMNCTMAGNATSGYIRGISAGINLTNCISQLNWDSSLQNVTADYCNLGNTNLNTFGQNNYNQTPGFVSPLSWNDAPAIGGDYSIQACSPDMDRGTNTGAPATDILGNARPVGAGIDAGAYEFQSLAAICTTCLTGGNIVYVKANAAGANNGKNWANAFTDLQSALAVANTCPNITEIWVSAGTYKPTSGTDRNSAFTMKNNLGIYGGFAGTENQRSQRNWMSNITTLSGDIGTPGNHADNSFNVVLNLYNNLNQTAILDGFSVRDGRAFGTNGTHRIVGGGVRNENSSPAFRNCSFSGNAASGGGGAVGNESSSATFTNCSFNENSAFSGGAMYNRNSSLVISHCTFSNNSATFGAGVSEVFSSSSISHSVFSGNMAEQEGGGMKFSGDNVNGNIEVVNCLFAGNTSQSKGGAFSFDNHESGSYRFINCTFWGNTAPDGGGTINSNILDDGITFPSLINCIVWGNSSIFGQNNSQEGRLHISHSLIQGTECPAWVTCGSGVIFNQDPLFVDSDNGDFRILGCSPALNVGSNAALPAGTTTDLDGSPRFFNNGIVDLGAYEYQGLSPVLAAVCKNATITLGADNTATVSASQIDNGSAGCGTLLLSINGQPSLTFNCNDVGQNMVELTVADAFGGTATCSATVSVEDNTPPTIICPPMQTLVLGNNCSATLPNYAGMATANDNCGVQSVMQSPAAGTVVSNTGNITVTLTVTDMNGLTNSCTFTVTKVDNTAPSITCPTTKTLVLGANCTVSLPNYTSLATTGDNCGVQGVTQSPAAGTTVSGTGNMTVTLTVTDINGLTNSCTFTVTKVDETPPTVVCKNTTVFLTAAGNYTLLAADVFNAAASSDNCSGVLTVTNILPAAVSCNQVNQTIPVTVTVQDAAGNSATCTAQITVQEGSALPENWSSNNVGNANGSAGYKPCTSNGQFTVTATGFSTSSEDVLHLTSRQLCGNGEIIARVANVTGGGWAGITLRETLTPGSKKVALKTQNNGNIRREIRTVTNGATNNLNYFRPAHTWLRLVRNGSTFEGYTSIDGSTWSFAFSATVSMTGCIYAGLFAESVNTNVTTTATFDNVQIIGGTPSLIEAPQTPAAASAFSPEVYPNPTTGEVNIDLSGYANPVGTVKVFDAYGKLVMQNQLDGSPLFRMKMDSDDGVYFLSIKVEGEAPVTKRVVVAH
ncbi:MAG: choice-of-anchor Q domain-containing protein [Saprospiraceae bacterium]